MNGWNESRLIERTKLGGHRVVTPLFCGSFRIRQMLFSELIYSMQAGKCIHLVACGYDNRLVYGRVVGLKPESGTRDIHDWIVTIRTLIDGIITNVECYVKTY